MKEIAQAGTVRISWPEIVSEADLPRLSRVAAALAAGQTAGDDGVWFADLLLAQIAASTQRSPAAQRNHGIRHLAELVAPGETARARAAAVFRELRRYRTQWNRRDRWLQSEAMEGQSEPRATLYRIYLLSEGSPPDSERHLRRILS